MKKILFLFAVIFPALAYSQAIVKGSGIVYTNGAPTHTPNLNTDAEVAIDTTSGYWYERSRDGLGWLAAGFRIQKLAGSSAPVTAPADKQSEIVLNDVDSLYRWRSGAWYHLNKVVTYAAGTGINITVGNVIENTGDLSNANEGILGVGAGGATSSTIVSNTTGSAGVTINASGILSISESTSSNGGSITISATEVDGSVTNEGTLGVGAGGATSSTIISNTSGATGVTVNVSGILSISESTSSNGGSITISATEVDGSVTNELQTIANTSDATSHTVTLSNSGGSVQLVEGANVTLTTTGTGSAGIVTIAASSGGGADLSYSGASSPVTLNSSTGTDVTITEGGIVTITATSSNLTISATEVDGSVTNELQTIANTSDATSHTVTLSNSGGSIQLVEGANITLTTTGTGSAGIVTIASTGGGGGTDLSYSGTSSPITLNSSTGTDVTFTQGGIVTITGTSSNLTISATEVDGSVTNELQTLANTSDATSHTVTLSNSGGSVQLVEGGIVTLTTSGTGSAGIVTISATEVDGSVTNEGILGVGAGGATSSTLVTNTSTGNAVTVNVSGILSISESTSSNGGSITISATEVDGSVTNEAWTIDADDADTEVISNQVVKFQGAGITSTDYNPTTDVLLITSTEVDGSVTNELQTIANTSDATSHTVTLSNSGGSIQLVEGANVTLTTTGTGSAGIVTIAASSGGGADLSYSGASSPVTLNSSTGADVTITEGGIVTITATSSNLTISATEVDGSITNEGILGVGAGGATSSTLVTNTSTANAVTVNVSGILSISESTSANGGSITITGTEVDGSVSNELQTIANSSDATSHTVTLSNSGGSIQLVESGIVTLTTTGTGLDGIVTIGATEVDGSVSNELQTIANTSDATSHTVTLSNSGGSIQLVEGANVTLTTSGTGSDGIVTIAATSGGGTDLSYSGTSSPITLNSSSGADVTFTQGGIVTITGTSSNLTISATEVDGSVSNELQTIANTSNATSHTVTLSNSGGSVQLVESGIVTLTTTGTGLDGIVTIGATEVDGSVSNELQTIANTSDATSHTVTLSNSGGSIQLVEGANVTLTTSGTGSDGIVTIAATSGGGTDLSYSGASSPVTLNSSTGTDVTFTQGGIVTITGTSSNLTISATEVDGSVSNELQTIANTSDATSHTVTLSNSGGSVQLVEGGIVTLTTTGTGSDGIVTIAATEVDGSVTNEGTLGVGAGGATSSTIISNTSGATGVTVNVSGILSISESTSSNGGSITITGTEVDGSVSNELQTIANTSNATSHTVTLSNSGGSVQFVEGGIVTLATTGTGLDGIVTISATEVDGSVTNEAWTIDADDTDTEVISNQVVKFQGAGITSTDYNPTTDVLLITSTEVDGSVTNELQTITNSSDATSHTVTLSNSGGSVQLVEGSNITLTTTGTGSDGIVTIAATGGGTTDLAYSGASSPVTLTSSTGTDVTFTQGGIVTITATSSNLTISATEVDGSITNEGILGVGAGGATSSTLVTNTSTANAVTVNVSGILSISESTSANGGSITITGTEVDGSVTNELQTLANTSNATSHTVTLSNSGGSVQLVEGGIVTLTTTGTGLDGIVTIGATEVDGSVTNELQTIANTSDATSHTVTLSNSGGSVQLVEGSNITLTTTGTGSAGIVTIAATGGGASTFLGLTDTPSSYSGQAGKIVAVNSGETGLEFIPTGSPTTITGVKTLLSNDETAGTEVTSSTAESSAIKTYNLAANSFTKIFIEAIVTGRVDPDALNKTDFTFRIKEAGSTVATFAPRVIGVTTAGVDGGGRFVTTVSTYINGGQGSTTALTITGQMSASNASIGLNVLAFRVYGIRDVNLVGLTTGTDLAYSGASSPVTLTSSTGTDVTFTQGGIVTITGTSSNLTISATEVDGSITNEGTLGVGAGGATSSTIISNTSGATGVTVNVSGILSISESTSSNGGSITITGTEVDGSVSNELQTIANTSDATSHTVTLSNSGGSIQLVEGSNITLTTTGTGSAGIVTIAATGGGTTDLSFTGASSPVTLNSSTGTDVTFTQGGIVTITGTSSNLTISATEVDGSVSNEGSLSVSAGGSNDSQIASNTSGSTNVTVSGGTGIQVTESGSTITISATATTANAQTGTSYTLVLSDAGKFITMSNAAANTLTIPPNSSVAFPTGTVINIAQIGAGQTTIAPGSGVTINSADAKTKLRVQYSSSSVIKTGTDTWLLIGDITN